MFLIIKSLLKAEVFGFVLVRGSSLLLCTNGTIHEVTRTKHKNRYDRNRL